MIITWRLGPYEVRSERLRDIQAWAHDISRDGTIFGRQFRVPSLLDAKAHENAHVKKNGSGDGRA